MLVEAAVGRTGGNRTVRSLEAIVLGVTDVPQAAWLWLEAVDHCWHPDGLVVLGVSSSGVTRRAPVVSRVGGRRFG